MRLPHNIIDRITLVARGPAELIAALGDQCEVEEKTEIRRLCEEGLPPVTSLDALSVMTGYNPGFAWSLVYRSEKYYRIFTIPKGHSCRQIEAPRVAMKIIQKWLSVHFSKKWKPHHAVHGFVPGRSHLTAASTHVGAKWILSVDIESFFPSTPLEYIRSALLALGYRKGNGLKILENLCSFRGRLAQGAPTSPVISNIVLSDLDKELADMAVRDGLYFSRYADDITFSGKDLKFDHQYLLESLKNSFSATPWRLSAKKTSLCKYPQRLKVHGLLVHGDELRLTKGYRNRIRGFRHLVEKGRVSESDEARIKGHLNYARQVEKMREGNG